LITDLVNELINDLINDVMNDLNYCLRTDCKARQGQGKAQPGKAKAR
jgi:hypothetical protein